MRLEKLNDFLREINAVRLWQYKVNNRTFTEAYTANGRLFLVQTFCDGEGGFEIFIPAWSKTASIEDTFAAVREHIGFWDRYPDEPEVDDHVDATTFIAGEEVDVP